MTCRNFRVFRVLGSTLRMKAEHTPAAEVRKILFVEKRRERLHWGMQQDLESGGPGGQVGNWVL
jgi:hypothetical protein